MLMSRLSSQAHKLLMLMFMLMLTSLVRNGLTLTHVPFEETGKQRQPEFLVWVPFSFQMSASLLDNTNAGGFGLIGTFSKGMR